MVSAINALLPADGVPAVKADLRASLAAAKSEIEALQTAQAAFPTSGFTGRRNRLINGNMYHLSRGGASLNIPLTGVHTFYVDRWYGFAVSGGATIRMQRFVGSEGITGFPHNSFMRLTTITPKTPVTSDYHLFGQGIEAPMVYDLKWGGGAARPVVVSFLARASITGDYVLRLCGVNRVYLTTFTINQANTWEYKSVAIPAETTGVFDSNTSTTYFSLQFDLGAGPSRVGAKNTWLTDVTLTTVTGAVKMCANTNAFLDITGVQLEQDTVSTPWEMPQPILESLICARYIQYSQWNMAGYIIAGVSVQQFTSHLATLRAAPTVTSNITNQTNVNTPTVSANVNGFVTSAIGAGAGGFIYSGTVTFDAEIT